MIEFSKRKFLALPPQTQHKKCAEILSKCYKQKSQHLLNTFNLWQQWLSQPPIVTFSHQEISDRYHKHLKMAAIFLKEENLLPKVNKQDQEKPLGKKLPVSIYLDHIRSAHNVGSIIRTVEAFQLGSVIFSSDTPNEKHPQVIKTSMGCTSFVNCVQNNNVDELPRPLIAVETCEDAASFSSFIFPSSFCFAMGNEEYGVSTEVMQQADIILKIPLYGRKNSLNVANAFAIIAATISEQLRNKECNASI